MALFTNEPERPERNVRSEQPPSPPVSGAMPAVERATEQRGAADVRTHLDRGARVSGKLHFESPARIDGQVDGEIVATDLTIGENAVVKARITAASIVVNGTITGELAAKRRIEIHPTAKVSGNLTAPVLVVHEGAMFDGKCSMDPKGTAKDREAAAKEGPVAVQIDRPREV